MNLPQWTLTGALLAMIAVAVHWKLSDEPTPVYTGVQAVYGLGPRSFDRTVATTNYLQLPQERQPRYTEQVIM